MPDVVFEDCELVILPDGSRAWRCKDDEAGDLLPTFVTPATARAYIDETDAAYNALDAAISPSSAEPAFKAQWLAVFQGWKTFATAARLSVGIFDAKAVMDQTDRWKATLDSYTAQFKAISPGTPVPTPVGAGQGIPSQAASLLSGTTGLVVAGAVLAAILVLGPHLSKG